MNGQPTIIGVGWRTVNQDGTCGQGVMDTRVDRHYGWILSFTINDMASGSTPAAPTPSAPAPATPTPAPATPAPATPATPAPAPGTTTTDDVCCVNGTKYSCPSQAACLGGFDLQGCLNACTSAACIGQCSAQASANGPDASCTNVGTCN
jgi:hypothetical protein